MKLLRMYTGFGDSFLDDEDWLIFNQFLWTQVGGYVCADFRNPGKKPVRLYLHRLIMEPAPRLHVHHKNRCRWDNRRENLEVLTLEDHSKRHPGNVKLARMIEAKQLWIEEKKFLERVREEEGRMKGRG